MNTFDSTDVQRFARTLYRHKRDLFGIRRKDRLNHMYVIGKTGAGKSTLLETLISQDIRSGQGCTLIDPHGDLAERVVSNFPSERREDLVYFNVPDQKQPFGYNPFRHVQEDRRPLAAGGLLEVFKKMWPDAWGVRMEHILRNVILALLDVPEARLPDILRLLTDKSYRDQVCSRITNPQVRHFFEKEYPNYSYRMRADGIAPIQNKVGAFLADPNLYRIVTGAETDLRIRSIMDAGKVLVVNLAKGQLGEDTSALLGGLLVTTISLAAFSRADSEESSRRDFYLYIDEFQNFTTLSVATMTSELRKYHVGLVLAHQYLHQLDVDVQHAVIGNAGTLISFRLGGKDAPLMAREFSPVFTSDDLVNLPNYHIYLRLMIDGAPSKPFSAITVTPVEVVE